MIWNVMIEHGNTKYRLLDDVMIHYIVPVDIIEYKKS